MRHPAGKWLLLLMLLFAMPVGGYASWWASRPATPDIPSLTSVFLAFDKQHPGRGGDMGRPAPDDHAMAYALYASAAVLAGRTDDARIAADWLVAHDHDGARPGWGLSFAWDAFSDGSTNPVTTVYGITTALAVRALLDVAEKTGERRYRDSAVGALDAYSGAVTQTPVGVFFWYSDQVADAIEVPNVVSMLMGQYARAGRVLDRQDYRQLADRAYAELMTKRVMAGDRAYWPYSQNPNSRMNDLVHASYIVQGLIDYARWNNRAPDIRAELHYLDGFITGACVTQMDTVLHKGRCAKPASLWGIGMLMFTLADIGDTVRAHAIAGQVGAYRFGDGLFAQRAGDHDFNPRAEAHLLFGLARMARP